MSEAHGKTSEKGSQFLWHCLIATKRYINVCLDAARGSFYSLDMVRLDMKIQANSYQKICDLIDKWTGVDELKHYPLNRFKPGSYRDLYSLCFEESSISVGLGLIDGKYKTQETKGYVEFNPNKVGKPGIELIRLLKSAGANFALRRFDIAIDFPVDRNLVRVVKDGRKYGCEISGAITEYLGVRNRDWYVKVYDKKAELNKQLDSGNAIDFGLTRVEITCPANKALFEVRDKLPTVFYFDELKFDGLQRMTKNYALAVKALMLHGDTCEEWLSLCDERTARNIRAFLKSESCFEYSDKCLLEVMKQAYKIADGDWKDVGLTSIESRANNHA